MFIGHPRVGYLAVGRCFYLCLDASIELCLVPRRNPGLGAVGYRLNFTLAWNWLPNRIWRSCRADANDLNSYSSAAWTGREWELLRIGGWARHFSLFWAR